MLNVIAFSVAGKKSNEKINEIILDILLCEHIPEADKLVFKHCNEVAKLGNYPSIDYFQQSYEYIEPLKSIAEIKKYLKETIEFYHRESIIRSLTKAINNTETVDSLRGAIAEIASNAESAGDDALDGFECKVYSDAISRPADSGFMTGVKEIDQITNGIQPGTVASIAAFTSEGKSTLCVSSAYKNIKMGKYGVIFSLEVHPDIVWAQLQSRYLFEEHNLDIRATELIQQTLTDDKKKIVVSHEPGFKEMVKNLLIVDETVLSKGLLSSDIAVKMLYRKIMTKLGGLDFAIFDHVNQFELMFPDMGNSIIRTLTSSGKTFVNQNGLALETIFAVQCNREGKKRANRRQGMYDLNAISDLNEVERSSTYVIFMYTTEDMRITQETKMTLSKHRLGALLSEPLVIQFNPAVLIVGDLSERVEYSDDFSDLGESFSDSDDF